MFVWGGSDGVHALSDGYLWEIDDPDTPVIKASHITFHGDVPLGLTDHTACLLSETKVLMWGRHPNVRDGPDSSLATVFDLGYSEFSLLISIPRALISPSIHAQRIASAHE